MKKLLLLCCSLVALAPWAYAQEAPEKEPIETEIVQTMEEASTITAAATVDDPLPVAGEVGFLETISTSFNNFVAEVKEYYDETQAHSEADATETVESVESEPQEPTGTVEDSVQTGDEPALEPADVAVLKAKI